ncbi:MAG TPA: hypothetical protein VGX28_01700 [Frankiaceae bacterium]|jgi:hypothetical protein|nr:hypothetical protein [Frankiaceae bacterium]
MFIYLALLFPVLILVVLLAMERVEQPLRVDELGLDLESFLDQARPEEVETFVSEGFGPALDRYWKRRGKPVGAGR